MRRFVFFFVLVCGVGRLLVRPRGDARVSFLIRLRRLARNFPPPRCNMPYSVAAAAIGSDASGNARRTAA